MKYIEKYLMALNIQLKYIKTITYEMSGGRSFYNVGMYNVEIYELVGTPFQLHNKSTGRKEYSLYKKDEFLGFEFNQTMFIEKTLKYFLEKDTD